MNQASRIWLTYRLQFSIRAIAIAKYDRYWEGSLVLLVLVGIGWQEDME